jgi:hypothetical protein
MSPAINLDLEDVPFAILEVVKARILANRRRLGLSQEQAKPRPSTRPRAQFRKAGASSRGWRKPQHGAGVLDGGIGLWKTRPTRDTLTDFNYTGWVGIRFKAAQSFDITYLGHFDNLENGLRIPYPIRVWRQKNVDGFLEDPEIIREAEILEGDSGPYAGGYRFMAVPPIGVNKDDIITIVALYTDIFFAPDPEAAMEDRYQFFVLTDITLNPSSGKAREVAQADPSLAIEVEDVETKVGFQDAYPVPFLENDGVISSVSVNFAVDFPVNTVPDWVVPYEDEDSGES